MFYQIEKDIEPKSLIAFFVCASLEGMRIYLLDHDLKENGNTANLGSARCR